MKEPYIVGISGGSGSGKSRVLAWLEDILSPQPLCLLSQDNYYHDWLPTSPEEMRTFNFDDPRVIDAEDFASDLRQLKSGSSVQRMDYAFNNTNQETHLISFHTAPLIIVEGIFIFHYPEIKNQLDLKIFIDVNEPLKFQRRITRDLNERGYRLEDILHKYTQHVAPAYEKYTATYRQDADIIICNNQSLEEGCPLAVEVLATYLKSKVYE